MAAHLQEVLAQYVGPILVQYAQNHVALEQAASFKAVEKSIPAVLAGVISHVADEHAAKRFFNLLTGTHVQTQWLQADFLKQNGLESVLSLGRQWMGLLFSHQAQEVQNAVAQDANLTPEQASSVLAFAVPAVLAALKQYIQSNQYGQHQFYGQLVSQESFFAKIFSPKLLAAIGVPSTAALVAGIRTWGDGYFSARTPSSITESASQPATENLEANDETPSQQPVVAEKSSSSVLPWLVALIVLAGLGWFGYDHFVAKAPQNPVPNVVVASEPQQAASLPAAVSDAVASAPVASSEVAAASASDEQTAPVAASAVVDEQASTDKVVVQGDVVKFYFATGSAKIAADAKEAVAPMIEAAKSGKKLIVSGYNDATGSAESNEWLAKKRAQAVRQFLNKQGVPMAQIELVKPEKTEGNSAQLSEDRRVEVSVAP